MCNVLLRHVRVTIVAAKEINIMYSVCVCVCVCVSVALVIQHAKRIFRIVPAACLAPPYFSTLSHKGHDFQKMLLNVKFVF